MFEPTQRNTRFLLIALLVLTSGLFAVCVSYGFLAWDDPAHVVDNPLTSAPFANGLGALFATPSLGYPAPLTVLGWALERQLFGLAPTVFHATNLALHLINVALAYALVSRIASSSSSSSSATAIIAASLVAVHPLVVEPVAWVTGRKDLQAAMFVLAGALALVRRSDEPTPTRRDWIIASLCGLAAILSKPTTVIAPLLYYWLARYRFPTLSRARLAIGMAPLAIVAAVLAIIGARGHAALGAMPDRDLSTAALDVIGAWALQLRHVIAPWPLLASYYRGPIDPSWSSMLCGAIAAIGCVLALRSSTPPLVRFGVGWLLITYFPVAAIVPNRRWVADSYMYLPLIGFAIACAGVMTARLRAPLFWSLPLVVVASLATHLQLRTWASNASLWEPVVEHYPDEPAAHTLYGLGLQNDDRLDEAAKVYVFIAQRWPDRPGIESNQAWAFLRLGLPARAIERLERGTARGDAECITYLQKVRAAQASGTDPGR